MLRAHFIEGLTLLLLPFLLLRAAFRRRAKRAVWSILVIQLGKIGDMVCTTPLFKSLHQRFPDAAITVLCLERTRDVLLHNPAVSDSLAIDAPTYRGVAGRLKLLLTFFHGSFDLSIAVLPGTLNAILGLWTCAPVTVHTRNALTGPFGTLLHRFHTHRLAYERHTRTFDHSMKIARAIGAEAVAYAHDVFLTDDERAAADAWPTVRGVGKEPYIIVGLSAGNRLKEWPLERFVEVARAILERSSAAVLLSSADASVTARALSMLGTNERVIDAGGLPLRLLSAVIARAAAFVSVDTGPLYIAHALGRPVVDIIGPVDPAEQAPPPGERVALVLPPGIAPSSFVAETPRIASAEQRRALDETSAAMVVEALGRIYPLS